MTLNSNLIPDKVWDFHVYNETDRLIGAGEEWTLPTLTALTNETTGAGLLGKFNVPMLGMFESMEQGVNFTSLYSSVGTYMRLGKAIDLTIRGVTQVLEKDTSDIQPVGIVVVERGIMKELELGKFKTGEAMDVSGKMEVTYLKIEVDDQELLVIDKLNEQYRVNGEDQMPGWTTLL